MKVFEMINALEELDPEAFLIVEDGSGDYSPVAKRPIPVRLGVDGEEQLCFAIGFAAWPNGTVIDYAIPEEHDQ